MTTQTQEKTINEVIQVSVDDTAMNSINEANTLAITVKSLEISSNNEYVNSAEFLKSIKSAYKTIDNCRKDITKPIDDIKKKVMDFFKEPLNGLSDAETILKKAILSYQKEQARISKEEEDRAIAKAVAEEDRKRKELEERAKKWEEKGNQEKAELLREKAQDVYVPTVVKYSNVEKIKGISTRKVWKAKIIDINKIPQNVYINDEKVKEAIQSLLNRIATGTKGALPVAGVEFYEDDSLAVGVG